MKETAKIGFGPFRTLFYLCKNFGSALLIRLALARMCIKICAMMRKMLVLSPIVRDANMPIKSKTQVEEDLTPLEHLGCAEAIRAIKGLKRVES